MSFCLICLSFSPSVYWVVHQSVHPCFLCLSVVCLTLKRCTVRFISVRQFCPTRRCHRPFSARNILKPKFHLFTNPCHRKLRLKHPLKGSRVNFDEPTSLLHFSRCQRHKTLYQGNSDSAVLSSSVCNLQKRLPIV